MIMYRREGDKKQTYVRIDLIINIYYGVHSKCTCIETSDSDVTLKSCEDVDSIASRHRRAVQKFNMGEF